MFYAFLIYPCMLLGSPSHLPWFYHPNVWWWVLPNYLQPLVTSSLSSPNISSASSSQKHSVANPLSGRDTNIQTYAVQHSWWSQGTNYPEWGLLFSPVLPDKCHNATLNWTTISFIHILPNSIFSIIQAFSTTELLTSQNKKNSEALVRQRTIPTERPPFVGEVSANFSG
jgi:hypothetical protein